MKILSVLLLSAAAFSLNLPLRVVEDQGMARADFPVTMGVPMPQGAFYKEDMDTFALFDARGNRLPAEFLPINLWEDTASVRWVLVNARLSIGAGETAFVHLTDRGRELPGGVLQQLASKNGNTVTVITGPLKFIVKGDNFNCIDSAWVDESGYGRFDAAHLAVGGGSDGFVLNLNSVVNRTSASGAGTIEIEENNRERAVICVKGSYQADVKHWTRIYAYHNKTYVRIVHTLIKEGVGTNYFTYANLMRCALEIKAAFNGNLNAVIPGQSGVSTFALTDSASIHQKDCDKYYIYNGAQIADSGLGLTNGTPVKPFIRTGWADLNNGTLGLSGGVRYFWEMYPKAVEVKAPGVLSLCLYKRGTPTPERLFPGMARTSELFLNFHQGTDTTSSVEANALVRSPLYLVAPNKWYCGQTQCVHGGLVDSAAANFLPAYRTKVADYVKYLNLFSLTHLKAKRAVVQNQGAAWNVYGGYGFVNFGDEYDEAPVQECTSDNYTFEYDNNYYDFPYVVLMSFFVNGSIYPLTLAIQNCTHMLDIDHVWWDPNPNLIGASRQCFSPGHVRTYDTPCGVYVSATYNHFKVESAYEMYYLTGDRYFLDRGLMLSNSVVARGSSGFDAGRSYMSSLNALTAAFRATHDTLYLNTINRLWDLTIHYRIATTGNLSPDGQLWMKAMALEGVAKAAKIQQDSARKALITSDLILATNHVFVTNGGSQEGLFGGAYGYQQEGTLTQNLGRLALSFDAVNTATLGNIHKYAGPNRSLHHWFQYLTLPGYDPFSPINYLTASHDAVETRKTDRPGPLSLSCEPNPFNPELRIRVSAPADSRVSLKIYDASGRLAVDLSDKAPGRALNWNAAGFASGLYLVRARCGDRTAETRVMLIR